MSAPTITSRFHTCADGLRLHLRDYVPEDARALPVVCLPGLARTADDFDAVARRLVSGTYGAPRRLVAIDYRGRGLSDRDADPKKYDLAVESADIQMMLAAEGITKAIFLGTSRGGIHTMLLAAFKPDLLAGVILNDIGPVLEPAGLIRIKGYVGKLPSPQNWDEAVALFKKVSGAQFPALSDEDWHAYARLTLEETEGKLVARYDPALARALDAYDPSHPMPDLWAQYEALKPFTLLAIRGETSDLLSPAVFQEMLARHPRAQGHIVPGQGHAPLLLDAPSIERICAFIGTIGS
jgi:pimeloyl-ACP methyl ester carboxylesterase